MPVRSGCHWTPRTGIVLCSSPSMTPSGDVCVTVSPGAAVLKRLGLAGMAAESFNGLFYRNCISYGFPAIAVAHLTKAFEEGDFAELDPADGSIRNLRTGQLLHGNKLSKSMIEMIDAGGIDGVLRAGGYLDD